MDDLWIIVPHWNRFQHYGKRNPVWIKNYTRLLDDANYTELQPTCRALLHVIWLAYGRHKAQLRQASVQRMTNMRPRRHHWQALVDAGFIQLSASKPPSLARARALAEEAETEEEEDTPLPPSQNEGANPRQKGTNPRALGKPGDYDRAENFVRNAGWQLTDYAYAEEIERRFRLDLDEITQLDALRTQLVNGTDNYDPDEDPF